MNELITTVERMSSIQIAEIIGKLHKDVLRDIRDEAEKLAAGGIDGERKFALSSYLSEQNKELPCYNLTREGVLQLAARYDAVTRAKLIEMAMRSEQPRKAMTQIEILAGIAGEMAKQEQQMLAIAGTVSSIQSSMQDMRNVIALDPIGWREECLKLVRKIAIAWGGPHMNRDVWTEIYKLIDARAGVSLETRLTNKRRRMADEGICKSKRDNVNGLDIIGEDRKLIEITVHIVKQMAIKHGVGVA